MSEPRTFTTRRRLAIALNVGLASLLAPALAGFVTYLSFHAELRQRLDLTRETRAECPDCEGGARPHCELCGGTGQVRVRGRYSLSDRTLKVLEGLEKDVEIYTCFQPTLLNSANLPVPGLDQVIRLIGQHAMDLVREYELEARGRIRSHYLDPTVSGHLGRIHDLARLLGEPPQNVVLVRAGERKKVLGLKDLADYTEGPRTSQAYEPPRLFGFKDEGAISGALLAVTEERPAVVAFLEGHGERDPTAGGMDAAGRGAYRRFASTLAQQNFEIARLDLGSHGLTREEVDILVVASPTTEIPASELEQICAYVREGGKLFLLLDPGTPIALDFPLLDQTLGLRRLPGIVAERVESGHLMLNPFSIYTSSYGYQSPIVKMHRDRGLRCLFRECVALESLGRPDQAGHAILPLVWTSPEAWLDLPDERGAYNQQFDPASEGRKRALTLGFSVEREGGGRAVVLGDSDFLDDQYLGGAPGNRDLGLNAIEWLAEREALISVAAQPYDELRVDLTPSEYKTILLYVVAAIPGLALLAALAVFWTRRQ